MHGTQCDGSKDSRGWIALFHSSDKIAWSSSLELTLGTVAGELLLHALHFPQHDREDGSPMGEGTEKDKDVPHGMVVAT